MAEVPYAVIAWVMQSGQFLAVSRKHNQEDLGFPGGKVNPGETPEKAVARELWEETGLHARLTRIRYKATSAGVPLPCWVYDVLPWGPPSFVWPPWTTADLAEFEPRAVEAGSWVGWVPPSRLVDRRNSFWSFYEQMFNELRVKY